MAGVGVVALEPVTPAVSPTILAAVSGPTPATASKVGASALDERADLALERSLSRTVRWRTCADDLAGDAGRPAPRHRRGGGECVEVACSWSATCRRVPGRVELVEVPAQPVDAAGPLCDEVLAVVDQQPQLTVRAVEPGDRQVRVAERRPGDGEASIGSDLP